MGAGYHGRNRNKYFHCPISKIERVWEKGRAEHADGKAHFDRGKAKGKKGYIKSRENQQVFSGGVFGKRNRKCHYRAFGGMAEETVKEAVKMGGTIKFDYYYGIEADQFSFYRVPRLLIKDERFKGLSSDAKLLYGLMLDRMSLSMKNGWLDDENRAYIVYTVDAIMEDLGCGKDKAIKVLAELDTNKGIGLVERIRRGLGKPDIIYVKNFVVSQETEEKPDKMQVDSDTLAEVGDTDLQKSEKPNSRSLRSRLQEVGKTDFRNSENQTSRDGQNGLQEVGNSAPIYTNYNQTDQNYTDMNYINPINQSESEQKKPDSMDGMEDVNAYIELIKENIEYEHHMKYAAWQDKALYEELFEVICEIVCVKRTTVKVAGEDYPYELVKSKFLKLDSGHLEYVMGCMKNTTTKIANIKSYMVTALYNAPSTINHYYQQEVQHDMYGGGWHEKGIV